MPTPDSIIDLTRGTYRRMYSGFLTGRRINAVSLNAEAWFWRLHAIADDFGNMHADPLQIRVQAAPRRSITRKRAAEMTSELIEAKLIEPYMVKDENYLHIVGFEEIQPAPRNGKRAQKVPMHPGESGCVQVLQPPPTKQPQPPRSGSSQPQPPAPGAAADNSASLAAVAAAGGRDHVFKILRAFWPDSETADDLADHPNASLLRVLWLSERARTEPLKKGRAGQPGFIRKGIEEGWEIAPAWINKNRERLTRSGVLNGAHA